MREELEEGDLDGTKEVMVIKTRAITDLALCFLSRGTRKMIPEIMRKGGGIWLRFSAMPIPLAEPNQPAIE